MAESNADRLLDIIEVLDSFIAQLKVDGQEGYAQRVQESVEELYYLYKDATEYE